MAKIIVHCKCGAIGRGEGNINRSGIEVTKMPLQWESKNHQILEEKARRANRYDRKYSGQALFDLADIIDDLIPVMCKHEDTEIDRCETID